MRRPGPVGKREKFSVIGKYLDDALALAGMSQAELARRAGLGSSSYLSRVMKGEREVERETLLAWCKLLNCPEWLEERILNSAGYASEQQMQLAISAVDETHLHITNEVEQRKQQNQHDPQA